MTLTFGLARSAPGGNPPNRWLEIRSSHFVVVSNTGEEKTRSVALDLDRVRALLERAHTNARFDSQKPVVVLALNDEDGLRELLPQFWERRGPRPAGAYWAGPYRQCIALRVDVSAHERYRRILHEYVHLLTHANVPDLPVWLDEGLSEFWGTAIVRDNVVEVGRAPRPDLRALHSGRPWIPLDELLAMERLPYAGDRQKLSLFYAQSWALVHYLMLGGPAANLEFAPSKDFGALAGLGPALATYVKDGRFRTVRVELPADFSTQEQADSVRYLARPLAPATSLAYRAGCLADGERPAAALPLLRTALADNPNEPSVLETLGYVRLQQNDAPEAAKWFDRAIATGRASHLAYFYRAILAEVVPVQAPDGQPVNADDYLRRAINMAPEFAPGYVRLADRYAWEHGRLSDALPLLQRATALEPQNPAFWVELGKLLASLNRPGEAREAGERGLAAARSVSSRGLVEAFLRGLPPS